MSNPLRILKTLDQHLTLPAEITLFGRSALALGYSQAPGHFHNTQDVDGILPLGWLRPPDEHQDFWQAVQRTNIELEPDGLYLTHLSERRTPRKLIPSNSQDSQMLRRIRYSNPVIIRENLNLARLPIPPRGPSKLKKLKDN